MKHVSITLISFLFVFWAHSVLTEEVSDQPDIAHFDLGAGSYRWVPISDDFGVMVSDLSWDKTSTWLLDEKGETKENRKLIGDASGIFFTKIDDHWVKLQAKVPFQIMPVGN